MANTSRVEKNSLGMRNEYNDAFRSRSSYFSHMNQLLTDMHCIHICRRAKGYAKKKSSTQGPFIWIRSHRPSPPYLPKKEISHMLILKILLNYLLSLLLSTRGHSTTTIFATFIITTPLTNGSLNQSRFTHASSSCWMCVCGLPAKMARSKCAELAMCTFQFISPAKLSLTSILHSGQW